METKVLDKELKEEMLHRKLKNIMMERRCDELSIALEEFKEILTEDVLEKIFAMYGNIILYFAFPYETDDEKAVYSKYLAAALTSIKPDSSDNFVVTHFKSQHICKDYCHKHRIAFTRDLYLMVKTALMKDYRDLNAYIDFFLPSLLEEDKRMILNGGEGQDQDVFKRVCSKISSK